VGCAAFTICVPTASKNTNSASSTNIKHASTDMFAVNDADFTVMIAEDHKITLVRNACQ
jgi:hypothetical protein